MRAEILKQRIPLQALIDQLNLEPNRAGYISCPAHVDKTPSLKIYDGDKGWFCFGCSQGGTVIDFYMHYFGVDFNAAVDGLARLFGLGGELDQKTRMIIQRKKFQRSKTEIKESETAYWWRKWLQDKQTLERYKGAQPEWPDDLIKACQTIAYYEYRYEISRKE